ncbi:hypothetical protein EDWATA_01918 [Edwardsiella tarda ATCC 23685]|uniref:Uncharacterized protein n=1 Tax=Edwardsiella tarda ATCC 23685 TaxID=500638 RepID=D4F590_EDWTA|nr:hypothetical protein EDWATA_01918 [Edwardsiella tarda ATCC 23685]
MFAGLPLGTLGDQGDEACWYRVIMHRSAAQVNTGFFMRGVK